MGVIAWLVGRLNLSTNWFVAHCWNGTLTLELSSHFLQIPTMHILEEIAVWLAVHCSVSWLVDVGKQWEGNFTYYHTLSIVQVTLKEEQQGMILDHLTWQVMLVRGKNTSHTPSKAEEQQQCSRSSVCNLNKRSVFSVLSGGALISFFRSFTRSHMI